MNSHKGITDFSALGWGRVLAWTVLGPLGCVAAALYLDSFNFMLLDEAERQRAIVFDIMVPLAIGIPTFFFVFSKMRELAIAHHKMSILASTDSLTLVLNRGAFTMLVDAYLTEVRQGGKSRRGAFLVVDADHFKTINDRFGHDRGDEALRLIAGAIKAQLRGSDLVGRLGGEEFGIFLPDLDAGQAELVAERIRAGVLSVPFAPRGQQQELSISIGGAVFEGSVPYAQLYQQADGRLYLAKQSGRNRIVMSDSPPPGGGPGASMMLH